MISKIEYDKIEFNIENLHLILTEVLGMNRCYVKSGRNYYYKKCTEGDFVIAREYRIDTFMEGSQLFIIRKKMISGKEVNNNRRSYSTNYNTNLVVLLNDLSNATFSPSDSYSQDYMLNGLKMVLRNKEIDKILS